MHQEKSRSEELIREMDQYEPKSFYREPKDEAMKGKALAKAVASDRDFLGRLEQIERGEKRSTHLKTYLYMENLASVKDELTVMSFGVCMYYLRAQYGVDIGGDGLVANWEGIVKDLCP
jgi:hypothetical protein